MTTDQSTTDTAPLAPFVITVRNLSKSYGAPLARARWEREHIKRKKPAGKRKLAKLDPLERSAIMECLRELEAAR